jgi:hypothetical protein
MSKEKASKGVTKVLGKRKICALWRIKGRKCTVLCRLYMWRRTGPGNMSGGIGPDGRALREKTGSVNKRGYGMVYMRMCKITRHKKPKG